MAESQSTLSSGPWPAILAGCLCRGSPCCQLPALLKLQWHAALGQEAVLQRLLCCEALLCKYTCPVLRLPVGLGHNKVWTLPVAHNPSRCTEWRANTESICNSMSLKVGCSGMQCIDCVVLNVLVYSEHQLCHM